ncbi:Thiamin diphosphate-binding protein [Catenaria anguillulae PL171]|uniref:2-oxoisovalerate dehydrogenase subunit alpha n=1 Tax=Catenaria anguillulae PL171 TaxID=765915 RepID=A0A1Y2HLX2_9FUNG|nr:Thiamin diphosphate-binding protein [Catenaria anguillulae PL171]
MNRPHLLSRLASAARPTTTLLLRARPLAATTLAGRRLATASTTAAAPAADATDDGPRFPGALNSKYTHGLSFIHQDGVLPTYRVLDKDGRVVDASQDPHVSAEWATKVYKDMVTLNTMDLIMYEAQRQGRISFYMTNYGEEATHMGSAAALHPEDMVLGQYREAGVLLYRGFTLDEFMNQCYSNALDYGKGRQMPVHYGSNKHAFQTISSPLGTQIPQAVGVAYAFKRARKPNVAITYFGEGAASEGDFHAALNMASTTKSPVIFFCRNNGFAISTPVTDQYAGDGIAARGVGYGIATLRVDGNDVFAVYNATRAAREYALANNKPVLIEAMTYRVGHHSTSDDSSAYRSKREVEDWKMRDNPVVRFRKYMEAQGWWDQAKEDTFKKDIRKKVLEAFAKGEKVDKPAVSELFTDVYDVPTPKLKEQERELRELMAMYPQQYSTKGYKQE